jgi:hypothetical protein
MTTNNITDPGESKKTKEVRIEPVFHLEITRPIEMEMDSWLRHMESSWRTQASTTIWRNHREFVKKDNHDS